MYLVIILLVTLNWWHWCCLEMADIISKSAFGDRNKPWVCTDWLPTVLQFLCACVRVNLFIYGLTDMVTHPHCIQAVVDETSLLFMKFKVMHICGQLFCLFVFWGGRLLVKCSVSYVCCNHITLGSLTLKTLISVMYGGVLSSMDCSNAYAKKP